MRSNYEIAKEIEKRSNRQLHKKIFVKKTIFYSMWMVFLILSMGVVTQMQGETVLYTMEESPYASLVFAGNYAGGYVLIGIVALTLGVVLTMICLYTTERKRGSNHLKENKEENEIK